jgi:hypothetical protein
MVVLVLLSFAKTSFLFLFLAGFQVEGGALKEMAPSGGRHENIWGISCEKSRFYAKKILFFPILGGRTPDAPPPGSAPAMYFCKSSRDSVSIYLTCFGISSRDSVSLLNLLR